MEITKNSDENKHNSMVTFLSGITMVPKDRTRQIRLPRDKVCTENGEKPVLKEVEACNRKCLNGGVMSNSNSCRCKPSYMGLCCEVRV